MFKAKRPSFKEGLWALHLIKIVTKVFSPESIQDSCSNIFGVAALWLHAVFFDPVGNLYEYIIKLYQSLNH